MSDTLPPLSAAEREAGLAEAANSPRRRHARILHQPGDEFNHAYNFLMADSYMRTHLHPGAEKIEEIHIVDGVAAVLYFDDAGKVTTVTRLAKGDIEKVAVPAFTWHTYVMLSERVVTYETMMGVYHPDTWKRFADWAPQEGGAAGADYLAGLRQIAQDWKASR